MLNTQKLIYLFITAALSLLLAFSLLGCSDSGTAPPEEEEIEEEPVVEEEEEEEEEPALVVSRVSPATVVINNHPSARPQSGLQQASIVYELLVEGGLTRLIAVYDTPIEDNFLIGPVRSLRTSFADLALEYDGVIAHSGYSQRTADYIRGMGLKQITSSNYLWRDSSRSAPHNLYTDIEHLYQGADIDLESIMEEEVIIEELPSDNEEGLEIEIAYHSSNRVSYVYDEDEEAYLRFVNDNPQLDRETSKQYSAHRVILRQTSHQPIPGPVGLVDIQLEGEGEGYLYQGGKKYSITWAKSGNEPTRYYHQNGELVDTRWGNTWIQVVQ